MDGKIAGAAAEWRKQNPVFQYRKHHKLSLMDMAGLLDVGFMTVRTWESGACMPNEENMEKLATVLGADIQARWDAWRSRRPSAA